MMTVNIYFKNEKCGELQKLGDDSFEFKHDSSYIEHGGMAISLSLPIEKVFKSIIDKFHKKHHQWVPYRSKLFM